jgi:hypothetical protein
MRFTGRPARVGGLGRRSEEVQRPAPARPRQERLEEQEEHETERDDRRDGGAEHLHLPARQVARDLGRRGELREVEDEQHDAEQQAVHRDRHDDRRHAQVRDDGPVEPPDGGADEQSGEERPERPQRADQGQERQGRDGDRVADREIDPALDDGQRLPRRGDRQDHRERGGAPQRVEPEELRPQDAAEHEQQTNTTNGQALDGTRSAPRTRSARRVPADGEAAAAVIGPPRSACAPRPRARAGRRRTR